jgi:hypothetical protein
MSLDESRRTKLLRRAAVIGQAITMSESEFLRSMKALSDNLLQQAADGASDATLKLPIKTWLAIIEEIKGRRPRNYSRLIADDTIERFEELWDKFGGLVSQLSLTVLALEEIFKDRKP